MTDGNGQCEGQDGGSSSLRAAGAEACEGGAQELGGETDSVNWVSGGLGPTATLRLHL